MNASRESGMDNIPPKTYAYESVEIGLVVVGVCKCVCVCLSEKYNSFNFIFYENYGYIKLNIKEYEKYCKW